MALTRNKWRTRRGLAAGKKKNREIRNGGMILEVEGKVAREEVFGTKINPGEGRKKNNIIRAREKEK